MERTFALAGAVSAFIAVAAGAFGSHALRARLSPAMLTVFETATRYQMYHAMGLAFVAWAVTRWPGPLPWAAGWLFITGTAVFSGSLYALALTGITGLGALTPLGGLCFLAGWICLAATAARAT